MHAPNYDNCSSYLVVLHQEENRIGMGMPFWATLRISPTLRDRFLQASSLITTSASDLPTFLISHALEDCS